MNNNVILNANKYRATGKLFDTELFSVHVFFDMRTTRRIRSITLMSMSCGIRCASKFFTSMNIWGEDRVRVNTKRQEVLALTAYTLDECVSLWTYATPSKYPYIYIYVEIGNSLTQDQRCARFAVTFIFPVRIYPCKLNASLCKMPLQTRKRYFVCIHWWVGNWRVRQPRRVRHVSF